MAELFYDDDADLSIISGRKVAVLGYGSQGHAHSLNLRDSGVDVRVGLPEGSKSRPKAEAEGLRVVTPAEAAAEADVIMILAPDHVQRHLYTESVEPHLTAGKALFFGHGFNIRFGYITPPADVDVIMVAPKGPGHLVRREYAAGRGVPVHRRGRAGRDRRGVGARAVVRQGASAACVPAASRPPSPRRPRPTCSASRPCSAAAPRSWCMYGFETLVEAGYQPEVAYFECLHELKLIVDLMYEGGIAKQRWSVSDTAEYGDYVSGPRVIDPSVKENMKAVLADIQNGSFAQRFIDDQDAGRARVQGAARQGRGAPDRGRRPRAARHDELGREDDSDYVEGTSAR